MNLTGLSEHLASVEDDAALELPVGGRTYRVRPPSVAVGARCVALWASRNIEDSAERAKVTEDALDGATFAELALGADVAAQMSDDGVSGAVITECATVALVAWALGQDAAQRYVSRMVDKRATAGDAPGEAKTSRSRRRSGTGTASARRTRSRASTRTTDSPAT